MRTETRQKLVDYTVYVAKDGKEFATRDLCEAHEEELDGIRKVCPTCNGIGYFQGRWVEPGYDPGLGPIEGHYEHNTCPTCNGKGYLKKKVSWE